MPSGNPLLGHLPMGYLGVGSADEKPAAAKAPAKAKTTRAVSLKKTTTGFCCLKKTEYVPQGKNVWDK